MSGKPRELRSCLKGSNRIRVDCYGNDIILRPDGITKSAKNPVPQKITYRD